MDKRTRGRYVKNDKQSVRQTLLSLESFHQRMSERFKLFNFINFLIGCYGNIQLSSTEHEQILSFNSSYVAQQKRKKVKISLQIDATESDLKFQSVTSTGNCCWKAWDRKRGGRSYPFSTPNTYQPGWPIRAIVLDVCTTGGIYPAIIITKPVLKTILYVKDGAID
jgi:hypothetical protein